MGNLTTIKLEMQIHDKLIKHMKKHAVWGTTISEYINNLMDENDKNARQTPS